MCVYISSLIWRFFNLSDKFDTDQYRKGETNLADKKKLSDKVDKRRRKKIVVGHDADGKAIVKYASGRTNKELAVNADEIKRKYITGTSAQSDILFETYIREWYETFKVPELGIGSQSNYKTIIEKYLIPAFGNRQMRAITVADLQHFMNGLNKSHSFTGHVNMVIKQVFSAATAHYVIDRDPSLTLKRPAAEKRERRSLTNAETAAALKVGREHSEGLLLLLLYYTGMRIGEALGLQWGDVDFTKKIIHVRRDMDFRTEEIGEVKTKFSLRDIPIPDELFNALLAVRGIGNVFVLQSPKLHSHLSQSTYKRRWSRLMTAMYEADNSIESDNGASMLTAHYFRHNYASILYNAGVDVLAAQKWLGHADVKTTLSIYAHLAAAQEQISAGKLNNAFAEKVAEKLPE